MKIGIRRLKQKGMVAIIVTLLIMFLLSIIVLAFAQLVRREQRQAVDRQLSTQAFYAAESGINAANKALALGYRQDVTDCSTLPVLNTTLSAPGSDAPIATTSRELGSDSTFKVTCILIDQNPEKLVYDSLSQYSGKVIQIQRVGGVGLPATLNIYWNDTGSPSPTFSGCPASDVFPTGLSSCNAPALRIDLIEAGSSNAFTFFALPINSGAGTPTSVSFDPSNNGRVVRANCNSAMAERYCGVTVDLGPSIAADRSYALRILPTYKPATLTITGSTVAVGGALSFRGAQATIDVTAKGNDVLRRLQAHVPVEDANGHPDAAIFTTQDVCKQLQVGPVGVASSFGGCPFPYP